LPRVSVTLLLMALSTACAAPQASTPTTAPPTAVAKTAPPASPAASPAAAPSPSPAVAASPSPAVAATIPAQPTAVLVATPPPSPVAGATVAAPTAAATTPAKPAAGAASPVPQVRAISELPAAEGALPVIETRIQPQDPGVVMPVEVTFQFAQAIVATETLRPIVDAVQAVPGVTGVKSDGVHMIVQYDSGRVQPAQIRQLLDQLGHAFAPGTDVPDAGDPRD
jgi:hypothetical protein